MIIKSRVLEPKMAAQKLEYDKHIQTYRAERVRTDTQIEAMTAVTASTCSEQRVPSTTPFRNPLTASAIKAYSYLRRSSGGFKVPTTTKAQVTDRKRAPFLS